MEKSQNFEKDLSLNSYQQQALTTAIYGEGSKVNYPILGLVGEAGEIANKFKKVLRDDKGILTPEKHAGLVDELGDVLWYCSALARDLNVNLSHVAQLNLQKLALRKSLGTINGSGDKR
jgi:NTP pyrophosphatase (non-canonical NTP hydrolase)